MKGSTRCRLHGGKSPVGAASATWKTGQYSKYFQKTGYTHAYQRALNAKNLGSMIEGIAVLDARIDHLISRLTEEDKNPHWRLAYESFEAFKRAREAKTPDRVTRMDTALDQLEAILQGALKAEGTWHEILGCFERRRKMVETEGRTMERLHQVLTRDQTLDVLREISELCREFVALEKQPEFVHRLRVLAMDDRYHGKKQMR